MVSCVLLHWSKAQNLVNSFKYLLIKTDFSLNEMFLSNDVSADSSLGAAVTFELDCDVVPSSNPSSADICSPEDDLIEQALFLEHFIKEDLNLFTTDCGNFFINFGSLQSLQF